MKDEVLTKMANAAILPTPNMVEIFASSSHASFCASGLYIVEHMPDRKARTDRVRSMMGACSAKMYFAFNVVAPCLSTFCTRWTKADRSSILRCFSRVSFSVLRSRRGRIQSC